MIQKVYKFKPGSSFCSFSGLSLFILFLSSQLATIIIKGSLHKKPFVKNNQSRQLKKILLLWSPLPNRSSILKLKIHFEIEVPFLNRNRTLILKSKLHFQIESPFWNRRPILKSKLHFQIEFRLRNRRPILKSRLHFEIEAPFRNPSSIPKSKLDFEIETPFWNRSLM